MFHDIIIQELFSSIKVWFIGQNRGGAMLNMTDGHWIEEVARKLMIKSWEILNRICEEPAFAKLVRTVSVMAFSDGLSIFEKSEN